MTREKKLTFKEIIEAAAKPYRELWHDSGRLNASALERLYEKKGHRITQETFVRIFSGKLKAGERTVMATQHVFGVPSAILRGEAMSQDTQKLLSDYKLSSVLLAGRIEALAKDDYQQIVDLLRTFEDKAEQLRRAIASSSNIIPMKR